MDRLYVSMLLDETNKTYGGMLSTKVLVLSAASTEASASGTSTETSTRSGPNGVSVGRRETGLIISTSVAVQIC